LASLNSDQKKIIVERFVKSGINVTPYTLELLLQLKEPLEKVNLIIKEASFQTSFNGYLTPEILNKTSDKQIQKILDRNIKNSGIKEFEKNSEVDEYQNNSTIELTQKEVISEESSIPVSSNQEVIQYKPYVDKNAINSKPITEEITEVKELNRESAPTKTFESTKSDFSFKPIAKEYAFQYKILKDPTGKIYTNGDYNDFYELTLDKFNSLRKLMKNRGESNAATNINNILRLSHKNEISVVGLVKEIRQTKKGNYFLVLEDLTGIINVILRRDQESVNSKDIEKIISDQMILINGVYDPGEKGKSGIVYGTFFTKIDIRNDFVPTLSPDPLSIALISDIHIGSKEFEEKLWNKFIDFLNGKIGNKNLREKAGKIKYIIINGDLVDGIGIYPTQKSDLVIADIYNQFKKARELISQIPDYIKIFYSSGNHDPVRNAIPRPAVPKKYSEELTNIGVKCIGNPCEIQTHNVTTLAFHGDSILNLNVLVPGLDNTKPVETMKELLTCRHLAPVFGKKTQIAPTNKDWLVIDNIPEIFHTGHVHINDIGKYRNVTLVNSGTFQSQTDYMNSLGIHPTVGIIPIIELNTLQSLELDLKKLN